MSYTFVNRITFIEDVRESSLQISVGDYSDPFITGPCHVNAGKLIPSKK